MFQRVLDDGYIIHASGNPAHKMVYGFYLYTFKDKSKGGLYNNKTCIPFYHVTNLVFNTL